MWHMKTVVIPVVVSALGTVKKGMVENTKKVSERATMTEIQKICLLGSYYDRDSKDLLAGICTNPQKGAQCMNRIIDSSD